MGESYVADAEAAYNALRRRYLELERAHEEMRQDYRHLMRLMSLALHKLPRRRLEVSSMELYAASTANPSLIEDTVPFSGTTVVTVEYEAKAKPHSHS